MSKINETGNLQVDSDNLLPIIKKWLYSDTDIFIRELVSNACDAISKLQRLTSFGDVELQDDEKFKITITIDEDAGTLTFSDNGIGMDYDEVKLYINQIAKSSAADFIEKYKTESANSDIIGHFGLGFYSAFIAAEKVQINTLSYKEGAKPVTWVSDGGITFEMYEGEKQTRGTDIILTINEDAKDFLEEDIVRGVLKKYMQFVPIEIYLKTLPEPEGDDKPEPDDELSKSISDTNPLWLKNASDITDEEYISFYHKLFTDFNPPLFWIHLNMDYPHRLRGILYFPRLKHEIEYAEGKVKLYCNQVFIADNIKEVIPEFLLLLKGVIDCPDLPLNVSRSFLQNDAYTKKLSSYITKKIADKLNGLFKNERENYEKFWDDIAPFIKYGCIKEADFYDKIKGSIMFKTPKSGYMTKDEYLSANADKIGKKIYYATDEQQQSRYINLFNEQEIDIALLTTRLDTPFISYMESQGYSEEDKTWLQFVRIDAALSDVLKESKDEDEEEEEEDKGKSKKKDKKKEPDEESKKLIDLFKKSLSNKADTITIEVEALKTSDIPAIILLSEESRRMQEMQKYFAQINSSLDYPTDEKLVLNRSNKLIELLIQTEDSETATLICEQVYDLAQMSHKQLTPSEMNEFLLRSNKVLEILAKNQ